MQRNYTGKQRNNEARWEMMAAANGENPPPSLDELYALATNTSNLRLNPDKTCAATHLIAASLLGNRMGQTIVHLRAEWDSADKPRKATEDDVAEHAKTLPKRKDKPDLKRARGVLLVAYAAAMRARFHQMRGYTQSLAIMREWAESRGVDADLLSPALYHYLSPNCPMCDGRGQLRMDDAPVLGKTCPHCEGAGTWPRPLGAQQIHDWLKSCEGKARGDRGGVIRGEIDAGDVKEAKERQRERARQIAAMEGQEADPEAVAAQFRKGLEKVERDQKPTKRNEVTSGD